MQYQKTNSTFIITENKHELSHTVLFNGHSTMTSGEGPITWTCLTSFIDTTYHLRHVHHTISPRWSCCRCKPWRTSATKKTSRSQMYCQKHNQLSPSAWLRETKSSLFHQGVSQWKNLLSFISWIYMDLPPTKDSSPHQDDYYTFLLGNS